MEEVDGMGNPKNQMVLYSDDAVPERLMSQMSSEIATLFFELPPPLGNFLVAECKQIMLSFQNW